MAEETITHRHSTRDRAVPVRQHGSHHCGRSTEDRAFRRTYPSRIGSSPIKSSSLTTGAPSRWWESAARRGTCAAAALARA